MVCAIILSNSKLLTRILRFHYFHERNSKTIWLQFWSLWAVFAHAHRLPPSIILVLKNRLQAINFFMILAFLKSCIVKNTMKVSDTCEKRSKYASEIFKNEKTSLPCHKSIPETNSFERKYWIESHGISTLISS